LGLSQQDLAKAANTTQKVISKIENADVNVGFKLLNKIACSLQFNCKHWSRIHNFALPFQIIYVAQNTEDKNAESSMNKNAPCETINFNTSKD